MGLSNIDRIRKLAIISLFYDDDLLSLFVLKGGNVLNLVYGVNNRSSMDIDISMENDFTREELEVNKAKLERSFATVFHEEGYSVFDFSLSATPKEKYNGFEFWGGYRLEFKVIEAKKYENLTGEIDKLRRQAEVISDSQQKKIKIDISKYEYCAPKTLVDIDGFSIYVYTPVMVVYEKLRAICQQIEEYREIVPTHFRPRARDFFDIHSIIEGWRTEINIYDPYNMEMLREIFAIKKVPISFLGKIADQREFHRDNFNSVRDTVNIERLESYDFYFDYVVKLVQPLELLWNPEYERETAAGEEN